MAARVVLTAVTLNDWLAKAVMKVAEESSERYSSRTVYGIECGLKRHLETKVVSRH